MCFFFVCSRLCYDHLLRDAFKFPICRNRRNTFWYAIYTWTKRFRSYCCVYVYVRLHTDLIRTNTGIWCNHTCVLVGKKYINLNCNRRVRCPCCNCIVSCALVREIRTSHVRDGTFVIMPLCVLAALNHQNAIDFTIHVAGLPMSANVLIWTHHEPPMRITYCLLRISIMPSSIGCKSLSGNTNNKSPVANRRTANRRVWTAVRGGC